MSVHCQVFHHLKAAVYVAVSEERRVASTTALKPIRFFQRRRHGLLHSCLSCCCFSTRRYISSAPATLLPLRAAASVVPNDAVASTASPPVAAKVATNEIGVVSRLSISRNATVASSWETVPNWCELCAEPVNSWDQHFGKREHICLEMTLNAMVTHPRSWAATEVWHRTELFRENYVRRPRNQPRTPSANVRRLLRSGMVVPAVDSPVNIFYETFDKSEPAARREELILLLTHLKEKGFLSLSPEYFTFASHHGQLVLYKELMPLLARVFPDSEVRDCSAMTAMVASTFNAETAFFLCGMEVLIPPELLRAHVHRSVAQPASAALCKTKETGEGVSSEEGNFRQEVSGDESQLGDDADDAASGADDEGVPRSLRSNLPRAILGALRWSLEPSATPLPPALYQHEERYSHYTTLAARASRLLLSELIYNRVSEYVCRVEDVLRSERGQEMMRQHSLMPISFTTSSVPCTSEGKDLYRDVSSTAQMRAMYTRRLVPHLSNHGMMEFTSGAGLRAANVLGTASSNHSIRMLEVKRATRLKSRKRARVQSGSPLSMSRQVRAL
ncbi:hypothetical protein ABL78_0142 [Leptomonas seymouri]|uniref:Uncharacterized protein n=1 Tax=Leptomonas seymouri TaxID=5684 RepID=A0A0N0P950_LEPSE|nr:hypothetical protein ABL78_0142 [Leptomonas seymouri]|eukprot:KPI90706.1 hypothetical protein ABL78_0142 [Leptomonas seymouri]